MTGWPGTACGASNDDVQLFNFCFFAPPQQPAAIFLSLPACTCHGWRTLTFQPVPVSEGLFYKLYNVHRYRFRYRLSIPGFMAFYAEKEKGYTVSLKDHQVANCEVLCSIGRWRWRWTENKIGMQMQAYYNKFSKTKDSPDYHSSILLCNTG